MSSAPEVDPAILQQIIGGEFLDPELPFLQIADTQVLQNILFDILPPHLGLEGMQSPLVMEAAKFAEKKLHGRVRKKNRWDGLEIPDVNHSYRVAIRLAQADITDEETIAAALLHDVIEDSDTSEKELQSLFGTRVARTVELLSKNHNNKDESISSERYYQRIDEEEDPVTRLMAIRIKYADRTDNLSCFVFMDLGEDIDRPEDTLRRGIRVLYALRQNLDETDKYLYDLDPEKEKLKRRLTIARSRANDEYLDFDGCMQ